MLLRARVLTTEEVTYKYGKGESKRDPMGMDWNWRYHRKLMKYLYAWVGAYVLLYIALRHVYAYVCMFVYVYVCPLKGLRRKAAQ